MTTVYDWITISAFAALIVLFLHRSDQPGPTGDALWQYLVAACGCALVNWLGNGGRHGLALVSAACLTLFVLRVLRPFPERQ